MHIVGLFIVIASLVLAVMVLIKYLLPIILPFIVAIIISLLLEPIIGFLQRILKMPRGIASIMAMLVAFGGIAVFITVIMIQLINELLRLSGTLPGTAEELTFYYQFIIERITAIYVSLPAAMVISIEQSISEIVTSLQVFISEFVNSIIMLISILPETLFMVVVVLIATYFFSRDRHYIKELLLGIIPTPWSQNILRIWREISIAFFAYLKAQASLVMVTTILSVLGLYLIGSDYALIMGLVIGFFDLIPVLGPASIYIPWAIWSFVKGVPVFGVKLLILYVLVVIIRQILETRVVSAKLGLHPLATLASIYIGLKTMGMAGLIMGPIILIAIQAAIKAGLMDFSLNKL